jgi:hypothetical protein
LSISALF